eukprot:1116439_1
MVANRVQTLDVRAAAAKEAAERRTNPRAAAHEPQANSEHEIDLGNIITGNHCASTMIFSSFEWKHGRTKNTDKRCNNDSRNHARHAGADWQSVRHVAAQDGV